MPDPTTRLDADPPDVPLYAGLKLVDDGLVVYDVGNHRAWLHSDRYVALADRV